jgi:hypothetical protein
MMHGPTTAKLAQVMPDSWLLGSWIAVSDQGCLYVGTITG